MQEYPDNRNKLQRHETVSTLYHTLQMYSLTQYSASATPSTIHIN